MDGGPGPTRVTKRLRYEVFNRDGFACRYCGAKAPDVELTVDHVVPASLGGRAVGGNLVTACRDCNAGKSSSHPDAPLIDDVADEALRWAEAMRIVAERNLAIEHQARSEFLDAWNSWSYDEGRRKVPLPPNWQGSLRNWIGAGLTVEVIVDLVPVAMEHKVPPDQTFRYFAGCCWRTVDQWQEQAKALIETGAV